MDEVRDDEQSTVRALTAAGLAVVVIIAIFAMSARDAKPRFSDGELAQTACEQFIRGALHDPDSAQFESPGAAEEVPGHPGEFVVIQALRARNGFNALRYFIMSCRTAKAAGKWLPMEIKAIDIPAVR